MKKITAIVLGIAFVIGATLGFSGFTPSAALAAFRTSGAVDNGTFTTATPLNATSTSATSTEVSLAGAKRASIFFNRPTSTANSTSTFSVLVTIDGTNYFTYNKLIDNVTNTNAQTLTRVGSKVLVGTTSAMLTMDLEHDTFLGMKCVGVMAATGTQSCIVHIER